MGQRSNDRISELPEFIIHNVMSLLGAKAAAQMATLSKKWADMFASYPRLVFLERKYKCKEEFRRKVDFTLHRFYERGLCLKRFQLNMVATCDDISRLDSWIELMSKCDIEELDLLLTIEKPNLQPYNLPGVLFASKSINKIRLGGFKLNYMDSLGSSQCSLRNLVLHHASIDEQTVQNLQRCCPLLESISLLYCYGFSNLQVCGLYQLKTLEYQSLHVTSSHNCAMVTIEAPNLEELVFHCGVNCSCKVHVNLKSTCERLKRLVFGGRNIDDVFLYTTVKRSLCLEDLTLDNCDTPNATLIESPSLQNIKISNCHTLLVAIFDTPKLCSFTFGGTRMASFSSINIPSGHWIANLRVEEGINNTWFQKLAAVVRFSKQFKDLDVTIVRDKATFGLHKSSLSAPLPYGLDKLGLTMHISSRTRCVHIAALLDGFLCHFRPQLFYFRFSCSLSAAEVSVFSEYLHQQLNCEKEPSCCDTPAWRTKCWRHFLKGSAVETEEIDAQCENIVSYRLRW